MKKLIAFLFMITLFLVVGCDVQFNRESGNQENNNVNNEQEDIPVDNSTAIPLNFQETKSSSSKLGNSVFYSFSSKDTLSAFKSLHGLEVDSKYNEEYFESHGLIIFSIMEPYMGSVHQLEIYLIDDTIETNYQSISYGDWCAAEWWYVFVEINKVDIEKVKNVNARSLLTPFDGETTLIVEMPNYLSFSIFAEKYIYNAFNNELIIGDTKISNALTTEEQVELYQLIRENRLDKYGGWYDFGSAEGNKKVIYLHIYNERIVINYDEDAIHDVPEYQVLIGVINTIYEQFFAKHFEVE